MKKFINGIVGKTVKTAQYLDDEDARAHAMQGSDPRVIVVFEDDTRFVVHETRQSGWIDWFIENPKYEAADMIDTLRWVVVNGVLFVVNDSVINAFVSDGMTGVDYDKEVPGAHWENIESIYPGAKLDGRHRRKCRG